ncbi:glycosyltransferase family 8 protein [Endomicrobium proavitum]|uniref:UDP-D-glucose:(Galactosyl)lipopolysaccharide glucosyltransferase n=1 Tax=Endomicrobium proavitum TaxID=1408281 RepID=A0A0G3WH96_9BACT|nr:glycosyltransferase family 8 protein [Endomicrobium proavitum]AKL97703.1 UDP-D-glucose:(galactosyl)lipopolysaccharide glucosyltransferase [Endomicrobium proavitum]
MINIAFGLSDGFSKYCATAVASILANHKMTSPENKIHFFFMGNLAEKSKNNFLKLKKIQDFDYTFIGVNTPEFEKIPLNGRNPATLYRLLTPALLPENIDKAITLGCDLVFNDDVQKLWDTNIDNYYIAAVKDADISHGYKQWKETYFNADVIMFNIKKLKEFGFNNKWKEFVCNEKNMEGLEFSEQDILNSLITQKIYFLDNIFNMTGGHCFASSQETIAKTIVAHFAGAKPWQPTCIHPLKNLYFKYETLTPSKQSKFKHYAAYYIDFIKRNPLFLFKKNYRAKLKNFIFKKY